MKWREGREGRREGAAASRQAASGQSRSRRLPEAEEPGPARALTAGALQRAARRHGAMAALALAAVRRMWGGGGLRAKQAGCRGA